MSDKTPESDAERIVDPEDITLDPSDPALDPAGELLADEDLLDPGEFEVTADETEAEELDPATSEDDPGQTEEAEVAASSARSSRPVKRKTAQAPVKKTEPTAKRKSHHEPYENERPVGPVTFAKQSVGELKKVNWPTGDQLRQYFFAVLLFVLFIIAFVGVLDLVFGWALLKLLG